MVAKLLKSEERRKAFDARWNEVKARSKGSLDEGSFEGPIVPIGCKTCEVAPKVSKGGSSGSGEVGADPLPEVPADKAQEEPLPEAPEAAASKAEEVKQRIAAAPVRLEREAYVALEEEFIAVAKPEDLRPQDREMYEAVRGSRMGVCARCRWLSGCQSCDEAKAWSFACRSTLWHTASEALRPKAKPRGRPKKAA